MEEETDVLGGQIAEATAEATPAGTHVLDGAGEDTTKSTPEGSPEAETKPTFNLDEEVEFEAGGKSFRRKLGDIVKLFESDEALSKREKEFLDREKLMNKDYTQKSQANAQFRKEFESTFGRFPAQDEMKALGKIWNSYFKDSQAKQLIDQILSGQVVASDGSERGKVDPYVRSLEQKIIALEEKIGGVSSSIEERETQAIVTENNRIFSTWAKGYEAKGIKITEEVDRKMAPFVRALRQALPDSTPEQVLDEAYKHATIDQLKSDVTKETLVSADKAKKAGMIKITPKGGVSNDASKSYKQMLMESA